MRSKDIIVSAISEVIYSLLIAKLNTREVASLFLLLFFFLIMKEQLYRGLKQFKISSKFWNKFKNTFMNMTLCLARNVNNGNHVLGGKRILKIRELKLNWFIQILSLKTYLYMEFTSLVFFMKLYPNL